MATKKVKEAADAKGRALTHDQVVSIRKMRGDHFNPAMSYAKIREALKLNIGVIGVEYAGRGITYADINEPKNWTPYPLVHTDKTLKRLERRKINRDKWQTKQAEKKARKQVKSAKEATPKKLVVTEADVKQKGLTSDQKAQILERLTAGESQKNLAADFGVNQSTISRLAAKHAATQVQAVAA